MRRLPLALTALFLAGAVSLNAHEMAIVKYRQSMMKAMGAYMSAMSAITKGNVPFTSDLATHAAAVRTIAHTLPSLFPAGTGPDKVRSESKPEIWTKGEQFRAAASKLESESARLQEVAAKGDARAAAAQFDQVVKACGSCHDSFRVKNEE